MDTDKIVQDLKNDYKTAEEWLLFYHEREAQYEEDSRYILDESPAFRDTGRTSAQGNGWTEYKVIQLAALDDTEKWLTTVKLTEAILSQKKQIFLKMRRWAVSENKILAKQGKSKVNWILFVQENYAENMAKKYKKSKDEFWLSEDTIKRWWKHIVNTTRIIALKRKCIF